MTTRYIVLIAMLALAAPVYAQSSGEAAAGDNPEAASTEPTGNEAARSEASNPQAATPSIVRRPRGYDSRVMAPDGRRPNIVQRGYSRQRVPGQGKWTGYGYTDNNRTNVELNRRWEF